MTVSATKPSADHLMDTLLPEPFVTTRIPAKQTEVTL